MEVWNIEYRSVEKIYTIFCSGQYFSENFSTSIFQPTPPTCHIKKNYYTHPIDSRSCILEGCGDRYICLAT